MTRNMRMVDMIKWDCLESTGLDHELNLPVGRFDLAYYTASQL
jgi:hypothetical protein